MSEDIRAKMGKWELCAWLPLVVNHQDCSLESWEIRVLRFCVGSTSLATGTRKVLWRFLVWASSLPEQQLAPGSNATALHSSLPTAINLTLLEAQPWLGHPSASDQLCLIWGVISRFISPRKSEAGTMANIHLETLLPSLKLCSKSPASIVQDHEISPLEKTFKTCYKSAGRKFLKNRFYLSRFPLACCSWKWVVSLLLIWNFRMIFCLWSFTLLFVVVVFLSDLWATDRQDINL